MSDTPVTNHGKTPITVGGFTVLPGETRIFPEHHVPQYLRQPSPVAVAVEQEAGPAQGGDEHAAIVAILEHSIPEFAEIVCGFSADELNLLEAAEISGENRKGILKAITEERLARSAAAQEMEAYVNDLLVMTDEELAAERELTSEDEGRHALVQAEIDKRAGTGEE